MSWGDHDQEEIRKRLGRSGIGQNKPADKPKASFIADLSLRKVQAWTVYSADSEMSGSEKGLYKDYSIASIKSKKSGWYGSDGEVREKDDIYEVPNGTLYQVSLIGKFTDVEEKYKNDLIASI